MSPSLKERVAGLCDWAAVLLEGHAQAATIARLRARLDEPLRVAIAGRVKAGKSTLLNALVGEELAPTDAGECTKIVTWYRRGLGYEVIAHLPDGTERALRFSRGDGRLEIHLDGTPPAAFDRLEVRWPSARLEAMTLIDTPGLESLDERSSARTATLLGIEKPGQASVDAVVYLMRHLHSRDADFLEAFLDRSVPHPSPVNAVAVLSRTDEIGAGRLDALESAAAIARRYASDPRVRALCATVVPVAGLIAETGITLREDEVAALRGIARLPDSIREAMLLSVDRFCDPQVSSIPSHARRELLGRFGLFGVRMSIAQLAETPGLTASALSEKLLDLSGIRQLIEVLDHHFGRRTQTLQARSVLAGMTAIAREIHRDDPQQGDQLLSAIEELEATVHEFAELRMWQILLSGTVVVDADDHEEIERLTADGEPHEKLGLPPEPTDDLLRATLEGAARWRDRGAHPLTPRDIQEVCEVVARSYEGLYLQVSNTAESS